MSKSFMGIGLAFVGLLVVSHRAVADSVTALQDISVVGGFSTSPGQWAGSSVLYVGNTGTGGNIVARSYLRFQLPSAIAGMHIASANIQGVLNSPYSVPNFSDPIQAFGAASDAWSESTISWSNQPGYTGAALSSLDLAGISDNSSVSWDVTSLANEAYEGGGTVDVVLKATNETVVSGQNAWFYLDAIESGHPFALQYTLAPDQAPPADPTAAPLPATAYAGLGLLGGLGMLMLTRRRKAAAVI